MLIRRHKWCRSSASTWHTSTGRPASFELWWRGNYVRTAYWACANCDKMAPYTDLVTRCALRKSEKRTWSFFKSMVSQHCSVQNGEDLYINQGVELSQRRVTWSNREEDFAVFDIPGLNFCDGFFIRCWACWRGNQPRFMNMYTVRLRTVTVCCTRTRLQAN